MRKKGCGKKRLITSNRLHYTLVAIVLLALIVGIVYAYGGTQPQLMGHSVGEINWSETISQVNAQTLNATNRICLSGNCRTSWPSINQNEWQRRVSTPCISGFAIRSVGADGTPECQRVQTTINNYNDRGTVAVCGSGQCTCADLINSVNSPCTVTSDSGSCNYLYSNPIGSCCVCRGG